MSDAPETIGPYKIEERIARGPLGRTYKATDPGSGRTVAVKVMPHTLAADPEALERFHSEVDAISRLTHPNVARIIDHGQDGDQVYYVVDLLAGTPLGQLLRQRRLSLPEAFTVFKGVALGLEAAHQQGIIHRDLHPANILVSPDLATIRVADFGISSAADASRADATATSMTTRTLHYIAPEQIGNDASADQRSDIYSLGVLLYEMLTGRVPIGQFNLPSRSDAEIPSELDPVVLKCLERDPAGRYSSVGELLQEIDRLEDKLRLKLASELRGIGRTFSRPTSHIFKHRKSLLTGLAAVLVLAAIAFGARYWMIGGRGEEAADPGSATDYDAQESPTKVLDDLVMSAQEESVADADADAEDEIPLSIAPVGPTTANPAAAGSSVTAADEGTGTTKSGNEPDSGAEAEPERAPSAEAAANQILVAAQARARDGRLPEAIREVTRLLATYPDSSAVVEALFLRARIEESEGRYDDAMNTYTEIRTEHEGMEVRAKARYRFGRSALESNLPNRSQLALGVFDEIPRAFPQSEFAPLALASKAAIEESENIRFDSPAYGRKVPAAFLTSLQIVESYSASPAAERAFWIVGEQYEDLKRWSLAAEAYWQLATRFPDTELEAWWKAGQVYDRRLDDTARAVEAYRQVPSSSPHSDDALKRISKLTK